MTDHTTVPDEAVEVARRANVEHYPATHDDYPKVSCACGQQFADKGSHGWHRWRAALAAALPLLTDAARAEVHEARVQADGARAQMASMLAVADWFEQNSGLNGGVIRHEQVAVDLRAAVSPEGVAAHEARIKAQGAVDALREAAQLLAPYSGIGMGMQPTRGEISAWLEDRADAIEGRA
jgi:hypothetical protein